MFNLNKHTQYLIWNNKFDIITKTQISASLILFILLNITLYSLNQNPFIMVGVSVSLYIYTYV